jgi:hypothetical protein
MRTTRRPLIGLYPLAFLLGVIGTATCAEDAKSAYPVMAPIEQYLEASASAEIALARTAAPPSISGDASVQVLGKHGYETAVKGKNGFVCMIWRSWVAAFDDLDYWNPKIRVPVCFNPAGVRTVLPPYLESTKWALAGVSKAEMEKRSRAAIASKRIATPEPGAMAYMMGREGDIGGEGSDAAAHHWAPHVMIFLGRTDSTTWGAGLHGSPISSDDGQPEPNITTFNVHVPLFSDGTPATPGPPHSH